MLSLLDYPLLFAQGIVVQGPPSLRPSLVLPLSSSLSRSLALFLFLSLSSLSYSNSFYFAPSLAPSISLTEELLDASYVGKLRLRWDRALHGDGLPEPDVTAGHDSDALRGTRCRESWTDSAQRQPLLVRLAPTYTPRRLHFCTRCTRRSTSTPSAPAFSLRGPTCRPGISLAQAGRGAGSRRLLINRRSSRAASKGAGEASPADASIRPSRGRLGALWNRSSGVGKPARPARGSGEAAQGHRPGGAERPSPTRRPLGALTLRVGS